MFAKAPMLAWLLTALTCLLTGLAVTEARRQIDGVPIHPTASVARTVGLDEPSFAAPTSTPQPTPSPTPIPPCDPAQPSAPRFGCTNNA